MELDHLFLDQDGIPTFVECKRASDTRTRREVVAQMLDYAANGTEYWSMECIRQAATETAQGQGIDLDEKIAELLRVDHSENDIEQYWKQVKINLLNNKVRLIFIADSTPKKLRRLIEFLNKEMAHVEVLGVEIKQYQKDDNSVQKALVPRVVGLTESARTAREILGKKKQYTTRQEFLAACSPESREFLLRVLDKAEQNKFTICWGTVKFSVRTFSAKVNRPATFVMGYPPDMFQVYIRADWIYEEKSSELKDELRNYQIF